jgi:6,7-dimethyl-8-ribityllumazine synthase
MTKIFEGSLKGDSLRIGIAVSRFNSFITDKLLDGALDALKRNGVKKENIEIAKTPGSFELPLVAKGMAKSKRFDALLCLGAVIKGDTPHHEYIASEVTKGLAQISLEYEIPVSFGVLTTENLEQAIERAGTKSGNKGYEAATTAIEMANLLLDYKKNGK